MHRRCETDGDDRHQQIKIERGELAAERARAELDAYKAAHDGLTPFEVARRSHDSQAMPDDRMEPETAGILLAHIDELGQALNQHYRPAQPRFSDDSDQ